MSSGDVITSARERATYHVADDKDTCDGVAPQKDAHADAATQQ